jgi:ABC-type uncharacterized transport system substrate-binding protein
MQRRAFLSGVIAMFATPFAADGQHVRTIRLGQLGPGPPGCYDPPHPAEQGLRHGLEDAGYVLNRNITIERRCFQRPEQVADLVTDLLNHNVDVLLVWSGPAAAAAKQATSAKPIVFIDAADPIGIGLIASFAKPGGNATGLTSITAEIAAKRLELLHQAVPTARRIGVLVNPRNPGTGQVDGVRAAATRLRLTVQVLSASDPAELDSVFGRIDRQPVDALLVVADPFFFVHQRPLVELVARVRVPTIYSHTDFARSGGLMAYAADLVDMSRRAAAYIDRIAKGANPADLPVEQPTKFELVINMRPAKALGLTIPPSLLLRADQVIE